MVQNLGDICGTWAMLPAHHRRAALRLVHPDNSVHDVSFQEMDNAACRFANVVDGLTGPQEVVAILLPKCVDVFYAFLGTLKAGRVVLPLFVNLGELGLVDRLADCHISCIVTKRSLVPRIERIRSQLPTLRTILVTDIDTDQSSNVLSLAAHLRAGSDHYESACVTEDTPSVLHYTSGSTGKPKGVLHCHGAAEHIRHTAREVLQLEPNDLYWCTADQGWITGTSYGILAPWLLGVTTLQFSGNFAADIWMQLLADHAVTVWYTAPTALRMLMAATDVDFSGFDLTRLRNVLSVGEPLNPEVSRWALAVLGRDIYDTWFQTETGGIMIANRRGSPVRHGSMGRPVTGVVAEIHDAAGRACPPRTVGRLCLKAPWPSMFTTYLNRTGAYASRFTEGYYESGDLAFVDEDGYFWFCARNDDVINTSGHLVSPFEVESALLELAEVAESGAIGAPDPILFEKVVVFVRPADGVEANEDLALRIRLHVGNRLSSVASPQDVIFLEAIPKNQSGKILRRVLKARYLGQDPGDLSTLQDES